MEGLECLLEVGTEEQERAEVQEALDSLGPGQALSREVCDKLADLLQLTINVFSCTVGGDSLHVQTYGGGHLYCALHICWSYLLKRLQAADSVQGTECCPGCCNPLLVYA